MLKDVVELLESLDLETLQKDVVRIYGQVIDKKVVELNQSVYDARLQFVNAMGGNIAGINQTIRELLLIKGSLKLNQEIKTRKRTPLDILDNYYTILSQNYLSDTDIVHINRVVVNVGGGSKTVSRQRTREPVACYLVGYQGQFFFMIYNEDAEGATTAKYPFGTSPSDFVYRFLQGFSFVKLATGYYNLTLYKEGLVRMQHTQRDVEYFFLAIPVEDTKDIFEFAAERETTVNSKPFGNIEHAPTLTQFLE